MNGTSQTLLRFASVNAYNLYADAADESRYKQMEALIRDLDADIIAVQEIISAGVGPQQKRPGAVRGLRRLAAAVDRHCEVGGEPAVAVGGIIHHTGLLWRDGITPVPGSLHALTREGAGMWHCAISAVFDFAGQPVRIGSVQLSPFDLAWSTSDVSQLLRVFNSGHAPGLLGGDFNCVAASDPDPYEGVPWHPDHAYQLTDTGAVDRRPAHRLEAEHLGRMRDCARLVGTEWTATTGHHPVDHNPPRRLDRWYATHNLSPEAVTGYKVIDHDAVGDTTDHLPVIVEVDPSAL
jgi:endonuclease/exonuclease/phosphatase family metal-dependent hydrolase